jgi:hypothetical protein
VHPPPLVYELKYPILCRTHVHVTGKGGVAHAYPSDADFCMAEPVDFIGFFGIVILLLCSETILRLDQRLCNNLRLSACARNYLSCGQL